MPPSVRLLTSATMPLVLPTPARSFVPSVPPKRTRARWTNRLGEQALAGERITPRSRHEVLAAVADAVRGGSRIRAVGSGSAQSAVSRPAERWLDLRELHALLPVDCLRDDIDGGRYVRVEAGATLDELNMQLSARGKALPVVTAYGGQTIAGAVATASHGSSLRHGPLCDAVASVDIVVIEERSGVRHPRLYRIEPSRGITSVTRFWAARHKHATTLVQDDEIFDAVVVGLGCTGILVSVTLEVREAFELAESRRRHTWADLELQLVTMAKESEYFDLLLYPHAAPDDGAGLPRDARIDCLATSRRVIRADRSARRDDPECRLAPYWGRLGRGLGWLASVAPERVGPSLLGNFDAKVALQDRRGELVGPSHVIQRSGLGEFLALPSLELAVPLEDTVRAVRAVLDNAERLQDAGFRHTAPVRVTFVGASRQFLAMSHGRPSANIEVALLPGTRRIGGRGYHVADDMRTIFASVQLAMEHAVPGSRPHWGRIHALDAEDVRARYPRSLAWARVCERFNAGGTFHNAITEKLVAEI